MKLLLHTCCAPCLLYPLHALKEKKLEITGYFYNPNIHPFMEFKKRRNCLIEYAESNNISLVVDGDYGLKDFTRKIVFNEDKRCSICYDLRLQKTAAYAKENGFTSFSTTLLYSKYQNHLMIIEKCQNLASQLDIEFVYQDFRDGWQLGIDKSISENLYRQPYCGCIYSEQERYDNNLKKRLKKQRKKAF